MRNIIDFVLLTGFLTKIYGISAAAIPTNTIVNDTSIVSSSSSASPSTNSLELDFVKRNDWNAREPIKVIEWKRPVDLVVIHHSYLPSVCNTSVECSSAMRSMQNYHQNKLGWNDIAYNYVIGGDGRIYEGRGFQVVGAHTLHYNEGSLGICLIGDWREEKPYEVMLQTAKALIQHGLQLGYIDANYRLMGHGQLVPTECPGTQLQQEISRWDHFFEEKSAKEDSPPTDIIQANDN